MHFRTETMKQTRSIKFPIILLILLFTFGSIWSQSTIVVSGGSSTNDKGESLSMSIGQMDYFQEKKSNGSLSFGVQQPIVTAKHDHAESTNSSKEKNDFTVETYPNPTADYCHITIVQRGEYNYTLSDLYGRVIQYGTMSGEKKLFLKEYEHGVYILRISQNKKDLFTHKIIKE